MDTTDWWNALVFVGGLIACGLLAMYPGKIGAVFRFTAKVPEPPWYVRWPMRIVALCVFVGCAWELVKLFLLRRH